MNANTTVYVVYRHGSNGANQSRQNVAILGTLMASSREDAISRAEDELRATVYNNQRLTAKPVSRCSQNDIREASESDQMLAYA